MAMKRWLFLFLCLVAVVQAQTFDELKQRDRGALETRLRELLAEQPADWEAEARRQVELNLLARALGSLEPVRKAGLLVESPLWDDPSQVRLAELRLERHAIFYAAVREADRRLDRGDYPGAQECIKIALSRRPIDEPEAHFETLVRTFVLSECSESDDYAPQAMSMLHATMEQIKPEGRAIDSVVTADLTYARGARRADRPVEARRLYELAARHAALADNPITRAAALVARAYLYQSECQRQGYPEPAAFRRELEAWLAAVRPSELSPAYRPRLAEAAVTWAELALASGSPQSLAVIDSHLARWQSAGMQQALFARQRLAILQADELAELEALGGFTDTQEGLRVQLAWRKAQTRALTSTNLMGAMLYFAECLRLAEAIGLSREKIDLINEFAGFLRQVPLYQTFVEDNAWALEQSRGRGYRKGELQALVARGDFALEQGRAQEALAAYEQALAVFEAWVGELGVGPQQRQELRGPMQRVYQRVADLKLSSGQSQDAFLALVREQQAQRMLAQDPLRVAPLETALRAQEQAREQQEELHQLKSRRADPGKIEAASQLLASTKAQFFSTVRELRQSGKNYDGMLAIQPVEFAQLQKNLPEDALLIQYYPTDSRLYLFLVTRQDFRIRTVDIARAALDEKVKTARRHLVQPSRWDATSDPLKAQLRELYALLIAPAAEEVAAARTLAVVPTGQLLYLPFGALMREERFLTQDKLIVTLLRAADLARLARPVERGDSLLALGNPDGTLAGAEEEVRSLGGLFSESQVFVGSQADRSKLQTPGELVHLATHARLDPRQPNDSYLVLGNGGKLSVAEIFELPMAETRLVTLSACQTEVGESEPGAALSSLAEAFWVAGSPSLVASLWKVDDQATRAEMVAFYAALKSGKNLAEAMQAAAQSMIARPETAHPFYWAAFSLIGDWR